MTKHISPTLRKWLPPVLVPLLLILLFHGVKGNTRWMDLWVNGVMAPLEQALGRLWSLLPWFSVAELLTASALTAGVVWLLRAVYLLIRQRCPKAFGRRMLALAVCLLWLWAGLCWMWNAAYYAPSFTEKSGLNTAPYSVERLAQVTELFAREAARLSDQVPRDSEGHFAAQRQDLFSTGTGIYVEISRKFPCLEMESVAVKPIFFSRLQSILGFTGVYFPFTGEANVNIDAPLCMLPATIAHEMAHQRMVASEDEANFVGIAASVTSSSTVFQYSGYLFGLIHLCNALCPVAPDTWTEIVQTCFTPEMVTDWNDNNAYWDALSSPAEDAAGQVYDTFLKGNDQPLGLNSYGACVDLLVAYFGQQAQ